MLTQYQQQTQRLLNDLAQQEYNLTDITTYINIARGQIAASTHSVRYTGSLITSAGTATYAISTITGEPTGCSGPLNVRMLARNIPGAGAVFLEYRPWEWAFAYWFANPTVASGAPSGWAVQEPGPLGSIYLNPKPDSIYTLSIDCVGMVSNLATDSDPEAIPYPWTDGVPYLAAYLAYLNSQRAADAEQMFGRWETFAAWATKQVTPTVMPDYSPGGRGTAGAASRILNIGIGMPRPPGGGPGGAGTAG